MIAASCSSQDKNDKSKGERDSFYDRSGGWDYARIPLRKPYELMKLKNNSVWSMNLHAMTLQSSISNITGVNVIDDVIIIHSSKNTFLRGSEVPEAWFVIIPGRGVEMGFDKEEGFNTYMSSMNVKEVKLHDPDVVYESFKKKWPINWQADFK